MIDPIAVRLGPIEVHWYGIIIATAILIAALLGSRIARRLNEDPDTGWSMLLLVVGTAVVGARVYHVIHEWEFYSQNPALIPQVWNGGIGIPGAVAGGAIAIWIYSRVRHLNAARWMDVFAPALLLGQVIGRLGNFVNQELYGPPISQCGSDFPPCLPFGIPIDAAHRTAAYTDLNAFPVETTLFVPLFAYEMALNLLGMLVLLWAIWRLAHRLFAGDIVLMYLMWYGAVRAALETFRTDNWVIAGVPTAIWLGIAAFVLAGAWLLIRHRLGIGSPLVRPPAETDAAARASAAEARPDPEASPG